MKKKVKKIVKKKKKQSFAKTLFKIIGISLASVIGFVGASVGVYALFGGFKEKVVALEGMSFEKTAYVLSGTADTDGKMKVGIKKNKTDSEVFESVKLLPTNEDATKLDIVLSGGKNLVTYSDKQKDNRVGSPLVFEIQQNSVIDQNGETRYNKSGEFKLTARQDESNLIAETQVFVESAVQSFDFNETNSNGNFDKDSIYPGNKFTVNIENIFPANALDKPANCDKPDNEFYKNYGANYFQKNPLFISSNESVATVDSKTGEVTVVGEGDFTIYCYIPATYKDNSEMPKISDDDFWNKIVNSGGKFIEKSKTYISKSIEVAGIRATTNTIENLEVFKTYSYAASGENIGENKINLDLSLLAPASSNFTSSDLTYRLSDVQIFAGYKDNGGNYYIFGNQRYGKDKTDENKDNKNIILGEYFTIVKDVNPLAWNVRVEKHSTKDLYLIARIVKTSENTEFGLEFDVDNLVDSDYKIDLTTENENGVYYAFIKVTTSVIRENESMSFSVSKVLAQFDKNDSDKMLYLAKDKFLDLTDSSLFESHKQNQTYKKVKFFAKKGAEECIETTGYYDGENPEIQLYKKTENSETGEITFEPDDNGYYIKLNGNANISTMQTINIYAAIFEYIYEIDETTGDYVEKNGNKTIIFERDGDGKYLHRESTSNELSISISSFITFSNFNIQKNNETAKSFGEALLNGEFNINKNDVVTISFEVTNFEGFDNEKDLFEVVCLTSDLISGLTTNFSKTGATQTISFTGLNAGTGTIKLKFNSEVLVLGSFGEGNSTEIKEFTLNVEKNDVKSVEIESDYLDENNKSIFHVVNDGEDVKFVYNNSQAIESFEYIINVDGGMNGTTLFVRTLSGGIYYDSTKSGLQNLGKVEIVAKSNSEDIGLKLDSKHLITGETNKYSLSFKIWPHKLCENLQFYVYALVDGQEVKSNTITISVEGLKNSEIKENKNENNKIVINGTEYQQVIGGEGFNLLTTSSSNVGYLTANDLSVLGLVANDCEITEITDENLVKHELFDSNSSKFFDVVEPTICQITLKPTFWSEEDYRTLNFYILPKHFVQTTTISAKAGETISIETLQANASLMARNYGNKPNGAYLGTITTTQISNDLTYSFFITSVGENQNVIKGNEIESGYTAPNSMLGTNDKIWCEISYNSKTFSGIIPVKISASSEINVNKTLDNGGIYDLTSLFKIVSVSDKNEVNGATINKVVLSKETYQNLKNLGFEFYSTDKNATEKTLVTISENASTDAWNNGLASIKSLCVPKDLNVYNLSGLSADITVSFEGGTTETVTNFEFGLSFKLTEIVLTTSDVIYVVGDESDAKIIEQYVQSASESTEQNELNSIKDRVDISYNETDKEITFKANEFTIIRTFIRLDSDFITSNLTTDGIIAKAYEINTLFKVNENVSDETLKTTLSNALTNATFVKLQVENDENVEDAIYSLQQQNKVLVVKTKGTYNVVINILGRDVTISGITFAGIEFVEAIGTLIETIDTKDTTDKIYSQISYNLFKTNTKADISPDKTTKLLKDNDLQVDVKLYESDGTTVYNDVTFNRTNNIISSFAVNKFNGEAKNLKIKINIHSTGFTGIEKEFNITVHSVSISILKNNIDLIKGLGDYENNEYNDKGTYDLTKYFILKVNNQTVGASENFADFTVDRKLEYILSTSGQDDVEVTNLTEFAPEYADGSVLTMKFKIVDNEQTYIFDETISFNVLEYKIESVEQNQICYMGQTITIDDLRAMFKITHNGTLVEDETLKNQMSFKVGNESILPGSETKITLNAVSTNVTASLGKINQSSSIVASKAEFITTKDSFTAYSDTKISNYISCTVSNGNASRNIELNYQFVKGEGESSVSITNSENNTQNWLVNGVKIAELNTLTGELTILTGASGSVKIQAFIKGISSGAISEGSTAKTLTFNISSISKTSPNEAQNLFVGDQQYDLTQFAYFTLDGNKYSPEFSLMNIEDSNQNLGYIFSENISTHEILISKNNTVLAKLIYNNGYRCVLQTSSNLDGITLNLRGFLKITNTATLGYTLESLNTYYVSLTINLLSIKVDFSKLNDTTLQTIQVDDEIYYVLNETQGYAIKPTIYNGNVLNEELKISDVNFDIDGKSFIGKVNEELKLSFVKKLQNLSLTQNSTTSLSLPNNNGGISIAGSAESGYNFSSSKFLIDYVFVTITFKVGAYSSSVNLCLQPTININFEYDSETTNYASVYSPSTHNFSRVGTLLSVNKNLTVNKGFENTNYKFSIQFSEAYANVPSNNLASISYKDIMVSKHTLQLQDNTTSGYNISISNNNTNTGNYYYVIKFEITDDSNNKYNYFYIICVEDVFVEVKNPDTKEEITATNPIVCETSESIDLKDYIVANKVFINENKERSDFRSDDEYNTYLIWKEKCLNNLIFTATNIDEYTLTSSGIFTPKVDAFSETINFSLFNYTYSIYINGLTLQVEFQEDGEYKESDFSFQKGDVKYIYLSENVDGSTKTIIVNVSSTQKVNNNNDLNLNLSILSYNFAGETITNSSMFVKQTSGNITYFKYLGSTLITLIKLDDCIKLEIANNLSGELQFSLSPIYENLSENKTCVVSADLSIDVNYINPCIYEDNSYQNVLAGETFDLSNILSITPSSININNLNFSIISGANGYVSLNGSKIVVSENLTSEVYLKIKVEYNSIIRYVFVKAVSTIKNLTTQTQFHCLTNETINLTDYIKVYSFTGFDSQNLPLYELLTSFYLKESTGEGESLQITYNLISDPYNYSLQNQQDIYLKVNNTNYKFYTFKTTSLSFETQTCCLGESIDLYGYIKSVVNTSNLTNKNVSIVFNSAFVSNSGTFVANETGSQTINFTINNIQYSLIVSISNLTIETKNHSSVVIENENNQAIKYENFFAGQSESFVDKDISGENAINNKYFNVKSGDVKNDDYYSSLQFEITKIQSIENAANEKYDETKFSVQNSTICGKNSILVLYNGNSIFAIGQDGIEVFTNLKYETLINIKLTLQGNSIVENTFNVRLLGVIVNANSNSEINISTSSFNLNNLITSETNAKENNLNLNDQIKFYNITIANDKVVEELLESSVFTFKAEITNYQIKAVIAGKEYSYDLYYTGSGNVNASLFNENGFNAENNILNSGVICGVGNGTQEGSTTFVTFTTSISEQDIITYFVYNNDSQLLFNINSLGNVSDVLSIGFSVTIYAQSNNIIESKTYTVTGSNGTISFSTNNLTNCAYVQENGMQVLEVIAGSQVDLTSFLNGATITTNSKTDVIEKVDGKKITFSNVDEITYGYFDVEKTGCLGTRVYVKVYPYSLTKTYTDDFTYPSQQLAGTDIAINKNDKFKTFFIKKNETSSEGIETIAEETTTQNQIKIDLNEYVQKVSNINLSLDLKFKISKIVYCLDVDNKISYVIIKESDKDTLETFATLNSNTLILKSNNDYNTYYVYLEATSGSATLNFAFRVLQIEDNSANGLEISNNSQINLSDIVKVLGIVADKSIATANGDDVNLLNSLTFKLTNSYNSKISSNILYINEKDFDEIGKHEITLEYYYQNEKIGTIAITVSKEEQANTINFNGKLYEERFYSESETTLNSNLSLVKSAELNGTKYSVSLEKVTFNYNGSTCSVMCFKIPNVAIILNEAVDTFPKGTVLFKNPNFDSSKVNIKDVSTTYEYIKQNKLGVILLNVENVENVWEFENESTSTTKKETATEMETITTKFEEIDGSTKTITITKETSTEIITIVKTYKKLTISAIKEVNYKLNNYAITKNTSGKFEYVLNGEKIQNSLKFDLVFKNEFNNFATSLKLEDETISIVSTNSAVSANGIILNTKTGAISGSKANKNVKMFIKAYVQESNFNYGENFVLFEI